MLLRLWYTLATGFARPRLGLLDEGRVSLRVWPNDLDVNLHMNNSRYLLAMDLGRWDYGLRSGFLLPAFRRRYFPVLGSETLRFRRALDPLQRFELVTPSWPGTRSGGGSSSASRLVARSTPWGE